MTGKNLRIAHPVDAFLIAEMVSSMLAEMADNGGHALAQDEESDKYLFGFVRDQLEDPRSLYRINDKVQVVFKTDNMHIFDRETEPAIR